MGTVPRFGVRGTKLINPMRSRGASEAADVTAAAVAAVRPSAAVAAAAPPAPHKQEKWCAILCLRILRLV